MFLLLCALLCAVGVFVGMCVCGVRYGWSQAIPRAWRAVTTSIRELRGVSWRRVLALAWLAFHESLRRKVLVVFIVFLVLLLFVGWYLDPDAEDPARLYISFVMQSTNYLAIVVAVLLSCFSLPHDIRGRTIYTIVTKPVCQWEIVAGRVLGFAAIGGLLVGLMGLSSYLFVVRGLQHTHAIDPTQEPAAAGETEPGVVQGRTEFNLGHRHRFQVDGKSSRGVTDQQRGHYHEIEREADTGKVAQRTSPAIGALQARVPVYGQLHFLDRDGRPTDTGINVGKEWTYRGYIEGGSFGAGVWSFSDITRKRFKDQLPLEMTLRVFRTYKGQIEQGIRGTLVLRNPQPKDGPDAVLESIPIHFVAQEFSGQSMGVPVEMKGINRRGETVDIDIHDDLVHNGQLQVVIKCSEAEQYFGMAQADVYLRMADGHFGLNLAKGYLGIWFQMLLVMGFGVMFSTCLTGSIAMLGTVGTLVMGYFAQFITDLITGRAEGGGPVEAFWRLVTQQNLMVPLQEGASTTTVKIFDQVTLLLMKSVSFLLPNYGELSTTQFVAAGFDIPSQLVLQHGLVTLAYLLALSGAGFYILRSREIAA